MDTPLARYLKHAGMTRRQLADRTEIDEGNLSKIVNDGAGPKTARKIIEALPEAAAVGFDERHVLYPTVRPYADWAPPAT